MMWVQLEGVSLATLIHTHTELDKTWAGLKLGRESLCVWGIPCGNNQQVSLCQACLSFKWC